MSECKSARENRKAGEGRGTQAAKATHTLWQGDALASVSITSHPGLPPL